MRRESRTLALTHTLLRCLTYNYSLNSDFRRSWSGLSFDCCFREGLARTGVWSSCRNS